MRIRDESFGGIMALKRPAAKEDWKCPIESSASTADTRTANIASPASSAASCWLALSGHSLRAGSLAGIQESYTLGFPRCRTNDRRQP